MHLPAVTRTATTVQTLFLTALPHGGQRSARRNAWASMSTDATRARARREADDAMDSALRASRHQAAGAR
jgi:hypothetical protein